MKKIQSFEDFKMSNISLKTSIGNVKDIVVDKISEFLGIARDKMNDPENKKKLNDFLINLERFATKIKSNLKTEKGKDRAILLSTMASYASLFAGIWGVIFNSGLEHWWNPASFELGGVFFLKLALFFYVIKLILTLFKNVSKVGSILSDAKKLIVEIVNLFKSKTDENQIKESVNLMLLEFELL